MLTCCALRCLVVPCAASCCLVLPRAALCCLVLPCAEPLCLLPGSAVTRSLMCQQHSVYKWPREHDTTRFSGNTWLFLYQLPVFRSKNRPGFIIDLIILDQQWIHLLNRVKQTKIFLLWHTQIISFVSISRCVVDVVQFFLHSIVIDNRNNIRSTQYNTYPSDNQSKINNHQHICIWTWNKKHIYFILITNSRI